MPPTLDLENQHRAAGRRRVAGVDEAGRGPLAGPVMAAAVILPAGFTLPGLDDSKKLPAARREKLHAALVSHSEVLIARGVAEVEEIDRLNILRATHLAMERAVAALTELPDFVLIDGLPVRGFSRPHQGVVKGDSLSLSIAAASIIAKVERDLFMNGLDALFPAYAFARHKGYGTAAHLEALRNHGPCPHHRRSFQPVAQYTLAF